MRARVVRLNRLDAGSIQDNPPSVIESIADLEPKLLGAERHLGSRVIGIANAAIVSGSLSRWLSMAWIPYASSAVITVAIRWCHPSGTG